MTYSFHVPDVLVKTLLRWLSVVRGHQYGKMRESLAPEIPVSDR